MQRRTEKWAQRNSKRRELKQYYPPRGYEGAHRHRCTFVAAGQSTDFSKLTSVNPTKPVTLGAKMQSAVGSGMATAADKEAVAVGGNIQSGQQVGTFTDASTAAPETTGKVTRKVRFGE